MVAADLEALLEREGASVVGMASSVAGGLKLLDATHPEAAVLDLNLAGEVSKPLAAAFAERCVPFVIVTGYGESWTRSSEFRDAPRIDKPVDHQRLVHLLGQSLAGR